MPAEENEIQRFYAAFKSDYTKKFYTRQLEIFLDHIGLKGTLGQKAKSFLTRARKTSEWAEDEIFKYTKHEKKRAEKGQISTSTIRNFIKPVKLLCVMNKVSLPWDIILRTIPHGREVADDRTPTRTEIQKILQYQAHDKRIRPLVLTMASSGIRLGAWLYLKWKHLTPVERDGKIVAAQMVVYAKEPEEYNTFITPEAYFAINEWMDHRASSGENISGESWLMRNKYGRVNVNNPKRMLPEVIKQLIERAMIAAGLRPPLPDGVRRYEFKVSHGFRKFHYSSIDFKIGEYLAKILAGHSIGLGASYSKHKMEEYLEKYLKVVDDLTIERDVRDEHARQIGQIKEEQIRKDMQMQQSMETKDMEIQALKEDIKAMRADMKNIFEVLRIAKQNDGRIGKDRTMLDEDRNISFCEDYEDGGTRVVKIPIDSVQIEDQKPL